MTGRTADFCAFVPLAFHINPVVGGATFYGAGVPAFGPYGAGLVSDKFKLTLNCRKDGYYAKR
jgi:hypothetical protein